MAKPSNPSVKLTALEDPTIINAAKGIKNQPRFINKFLKKGKYKYSNSEWSEKLINISMPKTAIKTCIVILKLSETPDELLN